MMSVSSDMTIRSHRVAHKSLMRGYIDNRNLKSLHSWAAPGYLFNLCSDFQKLWLFTQATNYVREHVEVGPSRTIIDLGTSSNKTTVRVSRLLTKQFNPLNPTGPIRLVLIWKMLGVIKTFLKKHDTFIQRGCIILIKKDNKDLYIVTNDFYFK